MDLAKWLADCRALASPHLVVVLVGNKLDREAEREVDYLEGLRWAEENSWFSCLALLIRDRRNADIACFWYQTCCSWKSLH